ncbi:RDD family protein [Streptomyces sp. P38-E01]|uniref:RDD family protein n=1 Tax=Streptomyces tardus TaxID=2780544 RepID=A0A949JGY7_9ACTN|nr:RDD family protein [Streptomyces tardus]MBU7598723.1 RDD family protein [Streptomyces tardus]
MSSDEPRPGAAGEPNDPYGKQPQYPHGAGQGDPGGPGGTPYGSAPPPPGGYGGHQFGANPYGDAYGAADPLAGMPPLASRGKRLGARIIDALLVGIPVFLITGIFVGFTVDTDGGGAFGQSVVYALVYLLYEGFMLTTRGQTIGKKAMGIRVAMLDNGALPAGPPGWLRAAVYSLPSLVPCLGTLFWLVNVLFCTWDKPYQQCLHDKVGKTVVVAT